MSKIRGKWHVIKYTDGVGWGIDAFDFDTEGKALEYCAQFGGRAVYHPTIQECLSVSTEKELQSLFGGYHAPVFQIYEWLRQVPEAQEFIKSVDETIKTKSAEWLELLQDHSDLDGIDAYNNT